MKHILMATWMAVAIFSASCARDHEDHNKLGGTEWRLTAWSVSSLDPSHFTFTAAFDDSRVSGAAAVNSYSGSYTASADGAFSVGELQATEMGGSEKAMRAEAIYFDLLRQARKFAASQTTLTLRDGGNQDMLIFKVR